ncbi:MAG TPA: RrF2 family transcriptional regulator [Candidatus Pygmaiobacter gallistercoris]|nr:RrF2 family transcriptional regulator [Candidatus Pygmaiobacter gallistercoris]
MMISTRGRYALRVLVDLAEQGGQGYLPMKELAARQGISPKYLERILRLLVGAQLVAGVQGKGGGYRLTRAPEDYRVGEILRLTEGSLAPVACLAGGAPACDRAADCRTLPLWTGLEKTVNDYLDRFTLADLMKR